MQKNGKDWVGDEEEDDDDRVMASAGQWRTLKEEEQEPYLFWGCS